MIRLIKEGKYNIVETKEFTKILILDNDYYPWIYAKGIGEILSRSYSKPRLGAKIASGDYKIYTVKDEDEYIDLLHLELSIPDKSWQGYILPRGLPMTAKDKHRIIPVNELMPKKYHHLKTLAELRNEFFEFR